MNAPQLTPLQRAWLQELGLDRRMLARYSADAPPAPALIPVTATLPAESAGNDISAQPPSVPRSPAGLERLKIPANLVRPRDVAQRDAVAAPAAPGSAAVPASDTRARGAAVPESLEALKTYVLACQDCELHSGRSQAVFGSGVQTSPEWMIIGEAPGDHDDRAGLPFQGKAGILLRAMLASVGVQVDGSVFCTNIVKCRPLGNRPPKPDEIAACMPYLQRQIALLQPRRVLALGRLAAQALLGVDAELETLRNQVHYIQSETGRQIPLVATYHPGALLMRPQHKPDAWRDLNLACSLTA